MTRSLIFSGSRPFRAVAVVVTAFGLLTAAAGCKSHGLAPVSPNDPYAENAPQTPEEEAYYNDVYSGDWKKTQNPLGYFGLGKFFVSTTPPPHWAMAPPQGAKSMAEIYQENYQRQMAAQAAGNPYAPNGTPNGTPNGAPNGALNNTGGAYAAQAAAGPAQAYDPFAGGVFHDQGASAYGQQPGAYASATDVPAAGAQTANSSAAGFTQTVRNHPGTVERVGMAPGGNGIPAGSSAALSDGYIGPKESPTESADKIKREGKKEKNAFMKWLDGWTSFEPAVEPDGAILRGQEPDPPKESNEPNETEAEKTENDETAENEENVQKNLTETQTTDPRALPADPALGESWRSVNRDYLRAESARRALPGDEYIADGGDDGSAAYMTGEGNIRHLDPEDAVAGFKTQDGRILVEPSNRVTLYSPRFGSVRQVLSASSNSQRFRLSEAAVDVGPEFREGQTGTDVRSQEAKTQLTRANVLAGGTAANQPGGAVSAADGVKENIAQTRLGDLAAQMMTDEGSILERLRTADGALAVGTWGEIQEVAVEIEKNAAQGMVRVQAAEAVFTVETDSKTSRLSLFKMASKKDAAPGELIEFALRYENVGGERIENVTILDNLSARLEYLPDSAKSSRKATFTTKPNQTGSQVLRWEIDEPLEPRQYGVVSFMCRVR